MPSQKPSSSSSLFYIKICLRLQSNRLRYSLVVHMWGGGGDEGVEGMRGLRGGLGRGVPSVKAFKFYPLTSIIKQKIINSLPY